jgi:glycosyl transferase, family 25
MTETNLEILQNVFYINLEERKDRLKHVQEELKKIGIVGERVDAVKNDFGAIGCSMSHIKCLELAKERNLPFAFICEDDITFLEPDVLINGLDQFSKEMDDWDVLVIGGINVRPTTKVTDYCIRVKCCQTTTGYIVRKHYYDTLLKNFQESVSQLSEAEDKKRAYRTYGLDQYWKRLQTEGKWYMITPPTVIQYANYSDIEGRKVDYKRFMFRK